VRIARVDVYGYDLRYAHGEYVMSGGRTVTSLPSTVVRIETDEGVAGWGETCPLGSTYLESFAGGARAALRELAPVLVGVEISDAQLAMDAALRGHAYAKAAVDIACWDVLGRSLGVPVSTLLGGVRAADFPLYVAIPLGPVADMVAHVREERERGIRRFQLKLGADPREDAARVRAVLEATADGELVIADANGGWRLADAVIAARALEGLDRVYFEQPCPTLEECLAVRARTTLPMILDEVIPDVRALLRGSMEGVNLKLGRVGGLTRGRLMRDLGVELGLRFTVEDSWGGDLTTAAVAQMAATTPPDALLMASFMNDWTLDHIAGYAPRSRDGRGSAPTGPGLGVEVDAEALGEPLISTGGGGR
jgi:L-alanine-DL-glutamate epimerase-like enolase superfamily enzyme